MVNDNCVHIISSCFESCHSFSSRGSFVLMTENLYIITKTFSDGTKAFLAIVSFIDLTATLKKNLGISFFSAFEMSAKIHLQQNSRDNSKESARN